MSKIIQIHQPNIFTEAKVCQQMPGFIMLNTTIQHFVDFIEKLPIDAIENTDPVLATIIAAKIPSPVVAKSFNIICPLCSPPIE